MNTIKQTQEAFLREHFTDGYNPSDEELTVMREKLEMKGRLPERFWRLG